VAAGAGTGISMGGRIAMAQALDWPERVDRLVLIATSPRAAGAGGWCGPGCWQQACPGCAAVTVSLVPR